MKPLIQNTACHLVMGFLGSGKTSFINACIANFQYDNKWAILVNEAGQIGIDEKLFSSQNDLAIKQVSGGCICCTSQLPLQIALARLTSEHKPDRLWIEPTGLAHPKELIEQLSQPHWQTALSLKSAISIVNARQWQDVRYRDNDGYQSHVQFCDIVVVNRFGELGDDEKNNLEQWIKNLNSTAHIIWQNGQDFDEQTKTTLAKLLDEPSQVLANRDSYRQVSLNSFIKPNPNRLVPLSTQSNLAENSEPTLPFRYHDVQDANQGISYQIIGWRLPSEWTVELVALMDWLLKLPNWYRIKAVIHTAPQGKTDWQKFNFTPDSLDINSTDEQVDNRIEVIFLDNLINLDFDSLDKQLMTLFHQS